MADESEGRARALLAAYRRDAGPSPVATERLLASLRRSARREGLDIDGPAEDAGAARVLPLRRRGYSRQWVGVAVVGLAAAAALLAIRVAPRQLDADRNKAGSAAAHHAGEEGASGTARSRRPGGSRSVESAAPMAGPSESAPPIPVEAGAPEAGAEPRGGDAPGRPAAKPGESAKGAGGAKSGESPGSDAPAPAGSAAALAQEMALVRAVHDALAAGQSRQALALLDDHGRRFPGGALREEAAALRAVALCATDREGAGSRAAASFLAAHPGSLSAERVRRACGVR